MDETGNLTHCQLCGGEYVPINIPDHGTMMVCPKVAEALRPLFVIGVLP